jgi:hypothetical protein
MEMKPVLFDKDLADAQLIIPAFIEREVTEKFYFIMKFTPCDKMVQIRSEAVELPTCTHQHFEQVKLDIPVKETRIEHELVWLSNWG